MLGVTRRPAALHPDVSPVPADLTSREDALGRVTTFDYDALDRQVTIILSQNDESDRPLCALYFNLSSPYHKKTARKSPVEE